MDRRRWLAAVAVVLLGSACTDPAGPAGSGPADPVVLSGWDTVELPDDLTPATLARISSHTEGDGDSGDGGEMLVGGFVGSGSGRAPALARGTVTEGRSVWQRLPARPSTPYGRVATLVSVTGDSASVTALGAAHGGAHANARWTVWTGTPDGVVDRLQTFETFGGQEAGSLLAVVRDADGPLIVGTWQGAYGLDGALWRAQGDRWVRQRTPSALADTADRQVAPRTAAGQPDRTVTIDGSVIDLADGVRQSAAVWRGSGGDWQLTVLPDPGRRSEAWSTSCAGPGPDDCATVGSRDDVLTVWADGVRSALPSLPVGDADAGVLMRYADRVVVVASSHGHGRLLVGDPDGAGGWLSYTAPDGVVRSATLVGTRLYLVSGADHSAALSVRDLRDVLTG